MKEVILALIEDKCQKGEKKYENFTLFCFNVIEFL